MSCFVKIMALLVILYITAVCINSAPLTNGNGTNAGDLNGEKLMEIGMALKLPKLQMIGKAIDNIEKEIEDKVCDLHPCSEWTEWLGCTARVGQFGSKFRTRRCSVNMTSCEIDSNSRIEKEFGICICPNEYNITKHGFCMKLYADNKRKQDAAEQQCQKDGGHLINIDSEIKLEDVSSLVTGFSNSNTGVWIDGHREDVSSPWVYTYGSQKTFFEWYPGEPHNSSNSLCLVIALYSNGVKWHDDSCTTAYFSICEI